MPCWLERLTDGTLINCSEDLTNSVMAYEY